MPAASAGCLRSLLFPVNLSPSLPFSSSLRHYVQLYPHCIGAKADACVCLYVCVLACNLIDHREIWHDALSHGLAVPKYHRGRRLTETGPELKRFVHLRLAWTIRWRARQCESLKMSRLAAGCGWDSLFRSQLTFRDDRVSRQVSCYCSSDALTQTRGRLNGLLEELRYSGCFVCIVFGCRRVASSILPELVCPRANPTQTTELVNTDEVSFGCRKTRLPMDESKAKSNASS